MNITQEKLDLYKQLRTEDGLSRRAACAEIDVAESTMRGWEEKGWVCKNSPLVQRTVHHSTPRVTDNSGKKIIVIADTQCKSEEDLEYMKWIGHYISKKKPDVVVHIGDHYDFPSLSSYDKGSRSFEGRRLKRDIEAGNTGLSYLMETMLQDYTYKPRLVFCMGNHEARFDRLAESMPELDGFVGTETLPIEDYEWEVHPFLRPVEIEGIYFAHYLANPMTGKPYGGTALNQLKNVGNSFVVGHKQCLDMAIRPTLDGSHQIGIINGACYPFEESYKGFQGNNHFRGLTVLNEVKNGFGLPMPVSLDFMRKKYVEDNEI